jgi:hypothetical protein
MRYYLFKTPPHYQFNRWALSAFDVLARSYRHMAFFILGGRSSPNQGYSLNRIFHSKWVGFTIR